MPKKLYWRSAYIGKDEPEIRSWFGWIADGMTVYKAEHLHDETDTIFATRAFMTDADNNHYEFNISRKRIESEITEQEPS